MPALRWRRGRFEIATDRRRLDSKLIHKFLSEHSYWARGIPRSVVDRSLRGSLCFGVYEGQAQAGFARVITDFATYAYVGDVFVLPEYRGRGLSKWLMECIRAHPQLQGLRRWSLVTSDAHGLYRQFGFSAVACPEAYMEIHNPKVYAARPVREASPSKRVRRRAHL